MLQFSDRMFNEEAGSLYARLDTGNEPPSGVSLGTLQRVGRPGNVRTYLMCCRRSSSRMQILDLFRVHIKRNCHHIQSGTGFWHQLIDRKRFISETSATAIFTYCSHIGVNKGWIDAEGIRTCSSSGWNAVQTKVNDKGEVEGTCVGTGMAFDPAFYYNRPVNVAAAHGYGPVIMAGAEMLKLMKNNQVVINDSAVMFYKLGTDWRSNR